MNVKQAKLYLKKSLTYSLQDNFKNNVYYAINIYLYSEIVEPFLRISSSKMHINIKIYNIHEQVLNFEK